MEGFFFTLKMVIKEVVLSTAMIQFTSFFHIRAVPHIKPQFMEHISSNLMFGKRTMVKDKLFKKN